MKNNYGFTKVTNVEIPTINLPGNHVIQIRIIDDYPRLTGTYLSNGTQIRMPQSKRLVREPEAKKR